MSVPSTARALHRVGAALRGIDPNSSRLFVLAALVLVLGAVFALYSPTFLTAGNLASLTREMSTIIVIALGFTFVVLAGEIDLSFASVVALVSVLLALVLSNGLPVPLAVLLALTIGAGIGAVNGFLTVELHIPSFLATLGVLTIAQGGAIALSNQPIPVRNETFSGVFGGWVGSVPMTLLYAAGFVIITFVLLRNTRFGLRARAVGSNDAAARMIGLNSRGFKHLVFIFAGLLYAVGAILLVGRSGYGLAFASTDLLLDVLAAVMIGGSRLGGGKGSVVGTVLGAALIAVALNGITGLGIDPGYQQIAKGAIIVLVVLFMRR